MNKVYCTFGDTKMYNINNNVFGNGKIYDVNNDHVIKFWEEMSAKINNLPFPYVTPTAEDSSGFSLTWKYGQMVLDIEISFNGYMEWCYIENISSPPAGFKINMIRSEHDKQEFIKYLELIVVASTMEA